MKGNVERVEKQETGKVYNFPTKVKVKKDGTPKLTPNNSRKGEAKEVYPIKNKEDVEKIKQYFINKKNDAPDYGKAKINGRYTLLWVLGVNLGLRCSDIVKLKWGDIFNEHGEYKSEGSRIQEQKSKKYKTLFLNKYAREAIENYIKEFNPSLDPDHYIFKSRQSKSHIQVDTVCKTIQEAAIMCDIRVSVGTHTMRKTFGYHWYRNHINDLDALVHLQKLFNHSSPSVTLRYIGIDDEQTAKYYDEMTW